jgi:hypothetical protein
MKPLKIRLALLLFLVVLAGGLVWKDHKVRHQAKAPVVITVQQKAQHMIVFVNDSDADEAECTATAIGPHAILTAEHCNDGEDHYDHIHVDLSRKTYEILAENHDGHDHVIYLLNGPAFMNYLSPDKLVNVKPIQPGEEVTIYGDGEGHYPPQAIYGRVDDKGTADDLSDVDKQEHLTWYSLPVLHGDSGSAIYAKDGRVVGLVTYGFAQEKESAGFALGYSDKTIQFAYTFSPDKLPQQ